LHSMHASPQYGNSPVVGAASVMETSIVMLMSYTRFIFFLRVVVTGSRESVGDLVHIVKYSLSIFLPLFSCDLLSQDIFTLYIRLFHINLHFTRYIHVLYVFTRFSISYFKLQIY
jgi:hypothetical protein